MKKTTSQKFSKRLTQYGALSVALAGVADINGQVIYTDVVPDAGGFQTIDLNADTVPDFFMVQGSSPSAVRGAPIGGGYSAYNSLQHAFKGFSTYPFNYPYNLASGNVVSAAGPWNSNYAYHDFCYGIGYSNSQFCGVTDAFIGLRFKIDGSFHYGWARVDVISSSAYLLKDFAYESTAGAPITIPNPSTLGIEDNVFSKIKVVALNKSIGLYNLPSSSDYKIYNMTGQEILKGSTNQKDYVIEASTLASGVYIVELGDTNTTAVIRKKVVLQ